MKSLKNYISQNEIDYVLRFLEDNGNPAIIELFVAHQTSDKIWKNIRKIKCREFTACKNMQIFCYGKRVAFRVNESILYLNSNASDFNETHINVIKR